MQGQDKPSSPDRLEERLRAWGAAEDARRQGASAVPWRAAAAPPVRLAALRPWWALAAAFVFFVGGTAMLVLSRTAPSELVTPLLQEDLDHLRADLAAKQQSLDDLRATLAAAQDRLAAQTMASDLALADKQAALDAALAGLSDQTARLQAQGERLKDLETQVAAATDKLSSARAEAAVHSDRLDAAALTAQRALLAAAALRDNQAATVALLRQLDLADERPGGEGLRARQAAVREGQLIRRGAALRATLSDERTGRLFDTLESLLTQLELLDVADPVQCKACARLLQTLDLTAQVRDVLLTLDDTQTNVRGWLIESRLVLKGFERAS